MTNNDPAAPVIIQGGMGFSISTWSLARKISLRGGLGTVSGVAPERILALALQKGDEGGHIRRALHHFPFPEIAETVLREFLIEKDNPKNLKPHPIPVFSLHPSPLLIALSICANFVYIWLAKENNPKPISVNYLEKITIPHIYAITGAMLAGVDYITMGAGIPLQIPEVMHSIAENRPVSYRIPVDGKTIKSYTLTFDPKAFLGGNLPPMKIPKFLPIISSHTLAAILMDRLPENSVYGFAVEEPTAGGHNAPPRGQIVTNSDGDPIYGLRDVVDYSKIAKIGLPFWVGGSKASPEKLKEVRALGASGIQVGTAFALCEDSGMKPELRNLVKKLAFEGKLKVKTHLLASPTGFPFKVASIPDSLYETQVYNNRDRRCDHGVLVTLYEKADGTIGYRCPAEPAHLFVSKGGKVDDMTDRRCICSGLMATAGLGNMDEPPIVTLGDDASRLMSKLMRSPNDSFTVDDVFNYLES